LPLEGVIDLSEQVNKIKKDIEKTQKEFEKLKRSLRIQNSLKMLQMML
jgi:valyl-tRNA synthetase